MADLLLELFSEEIPARMQAQAAKDLERLVVGALSDRGLLFEGAKAFAGPRRLTLAIAGLPAKQPDVSEELKGPKVDAPQAALDGFLRKTGLAKEQLRIEKTPKGDVYLAMIARAGRATAEVLSEMLPETFTKLPWPKSMRFPGSAVRWVRPLHAIVATFDGEVVPFEFAGVASGNVTFGHRFLSNGPIEVRRFDDYAERLEKAHVVLDAERRKAIIFENVKQAAFIHGLEMIPDETLLDEVAGLAEYPVVLIGAIEDQFMDVPPEILQTSMRTHQKYFSLRDPKTGKMANRFALVANTVASDGGQQIVAGNERVLRARLSDAKFFWDQDRKRTLESRVEDLKGIVFHAKLGTQYERVERIEALAGEIAEKIGADVTKAKRAARLCKADLTTGLVGEFPELQGVMGRYYALHDGEDAEVADAVRDHYKPMGPSDVVPTQKTSIAVALADKLDAIAGFFSVGEKPSGSGDPFALRRAALGIIRIVIDQSIRLALNPILALRLGHDLVTEVDVQGDEESSVIHLRLWYRDRDIGHSSYRVYGPVTDAQIVEAKSNYEAWWFGVVSDELLVFLADRLVVALREKGIRHDLINAVFSLGNEDDLVRLVARVNALQTFLKTDDGAHLLAAYKRASKIVKIEEKKGDTTFDGAVDVDYLHEPEARTLFVALSQAQIDVAAPLAAENFVEAMTVLAGLRDTVDAFFENVRVNDENSAIRENKLRLLTHLWSTLNFVADFSKIEG
ncbi:MAG TPA: glycine--tRNA ligase subunit beta [Rhizomicrobium sp.]|nr:glycine--tRNA ligase subunit beta [Rhizomicrobium sp.]